MTQHVSLHGRTTTLVIAHGDGPPAIVYWGRRLADDDVAGLVIAGHRPRPHGALDTEAPIALIPELGAGFFGVPGIEGMRDDGSSWAPRFDESAPPQLDHGRLRLFCRDAVARLAYEIDIELPDDRDLFAARVRLTNEADGPFDVLRLALSIPVPTHANELLDFTSRWCDESNPRRTPWPTGTLVNEKRRGRSSNDSVAAVFAGTAGFDETRGQVWGLHLGWSGNARAVADRMSDGRRFLQLGELLHPGEVQLGPGESIETPWLYGAHSMAGLGALSREFHQFLRQRPGHPRLDQPRKVLLNTWEAVYFDHDLDTLKALADTAAEVGAERFVLDDGWFHRRNDDHAALGDWWVDTEKYPNGLEPLVDHVTGLGLEFGLWFEPEMVNPDSELYRAHPEWVLADSAYPMVLGRNQLVLDLANPDAYAYVLEHIDRLLTDLDIGYVKWDMNRDHVQPIHDGRPGTRSQTLALYRMLGELNDRHPDVEIESCSSGGGRADFGILEHTKRVWTSDCNDALERQRIQRGFSILFPPELMGAHIGPHVSHTTRRNHDLGFRGATAFLGHLGIEWNLLAATDDERHQVKELVSLHKRFRPLLHGGDVVRLDTADEATSSQGVVAVDKTEAVFVTARTQTARSSIPDPVRFAHLDPACRYRVEILELPGRSPEFGRGRPAWMDAGGVELSGQALMDVGLQLPVMDPEAALIFHLSAV